MNDQPLRTLEVDARMLDDYRALSRMRDRLQAMRGALYSDGTDIEDVQIAIDALQGRIAIALVGGSDPGRGA